MEWNEWLMCLVIVLGRVADVSLGTVRTIFVVRGRRGWACVLGFFEVLIWVLVIARVIQGLNENIYYVLSYGLGFALGNYVGITIEKWLAFGTQVLQVFSRKGEGLGAELRKDGYRLTQFAGAGRDGPTTMLVIVMKRQKVPALVQRVKELDPQCFYTIEDVRQAAANQFHAPTGWRAILKRK